MPVSAKRVQARALTSSEGWKNKTSTGLRGGRGHEEAGRGHLCPSWLDRHGWEGRDYLVEPTASAPACSRERAKAWIERRRMPSVPAFPKYFSLVLISKLSDCGKEKKSNLHVQPRAGRHIIDELGLRRNIALGRPLTVPSASSPWSRRQAAVRGCWYHTACRAFGD